MDKEDFSTIKYLERLDQNLLKNSKSLYQEGSAEFSLVKVCHDALDISKYSLCTHILHYCKNPFWVSFLQENEPVLNAEEGFVENCFNIIAIIEIVINEVKVVGVLSSVMPGIIDNFNSMKSLYDNDYKKKYYKVVNDYESVVRFSILYWRVLKDFEDNNKKTIINEFESISDKFSSLSESLDGNISDFDKKTESLKSSLDAMEKKAGFLSLYAGFDKYAVAIKKRLFWLVLEKIVWIVGIGGAIFFGLYLNLVKDSDWTSLIPLVGVVLFFSTLLKVNLKKTDQYEQIMSKVEHKLAVSTFYQSELIKMEEGKGKEAVNEEYYRFLFSEIETTDWNTPDIASDIANILKSYKK